MLDITIIVPLKKLGKAEEKYLNTALKSITEINGKESLSLMFVGPKKVIEKALEKAEAIFKTTEIAIQCDLIVNDDTNIFERRLESDILKKAVTIIVVNLSLIMLSTVVISALQRELAMGDIAFETFSALLPVQ